MNDPRTNPGWRRFEADLIYLHGRLRPDCAILVAPDGKIAAAGESAKLEAPDAVDVRRFPGALLPGTVNAHSHAFQIMLRGRADSATDFRDWVDSYMYVLAADLDADEIELASTLAFAEMIRNGITTVGEFFYLNNLPQGADFRPSGNENVRRVIAAARRVGLRIHLLRCLYDRAERPGQRRFHERADDAVAATLDLAQEHDSSPDVTVGIAPHSLHGATAEGIEAAAACAEQLGMPFQIHIAEERHDIDFAKQSYGTTPGRVLADLGVVSDRLCVVHGVWLDRHEIDTLGDAGAKCAYNPISNMALGDGITDIAAMIGAGVTVGLGCDGPCANHQVNVFQEMRFAEWLQRISKLRMNVIPDAARDRAESVNYCFEMGTANGGEILGLPVGRLEPGYWADMAVVDVDDLSMLPHHDRDPEAVLHNLVHSLAVRGAITHVFTAGQEVLAGGRLTRIDEEALKRRVGSWSFEPPSDEG